MRNLVPAILFASSFLSYAQTADNKPIEPTAIGEVYLLDSATQTLKHLPSEQWKERGKAKNPTGWTGSNFVLMVAGDHSTFRVKAGDKLAFIFKIGDPGYVKLYPFVLKKNERQAYYGELGYVGREWKPIPGLDVEISQFGASSYKLVPTSPLAPGEYVITAREKVFTFGVDE
ncbi:MAG TPA: hypothetical protein VMI31_03930 [Fimbriimonadaceae bacterium]|nr:hypothetical protein [Fimbriimonadaceae bacterium]